MSRENSIQEMRELSNAVRQIHLGTSHTCTNNCPIRRALWSLVRLAQDFVSKPLEAEIAKMKTEAQEMFLVISHLEAALETVPTQSGELH